ncbi:MAG: RidA family protein [Firmicutes bacterium]|nr:RidA family protein [Bacillota bacterium]
MEGDCQVDVYQRIKELGLALPKVPKPLASYVPARVYRDLVFSSGQTGTVDGQLRWQGKVGREVSLEDAQASARQSVLNCLAAIESVIGDLNRVEEVIKLTGFVASAEGFNQQPAVVEGASKLLIDIFGDKGQHARSAIGVAGLPLSAPVEIEVIVKVNL